ncbi:MAG: MazG nucleotide pyrophosphohydrolase domain-containing protein [Paludibacter sp.]|nr:MazG nucleotide pyrophosphohydrolase domain-containing protein [Paludibacter sp.]
MSYPTDAEDLIYAHCEWVKSMGWWNNKTPLESLMLVVSECGEAANEVRCDTPTDKFRYELADIVLRVFVIAKEHDIDIMRSIKDKMEINSKRDKNKDRVK